MAEHARSSDPTGLFDIAVSLASVYPAAVRAGAGYWVEVAASVSSYYVEILEAMLRAWRHPLDGTRAIADVVERFKTYLERSGDNVERAILEFNQGLVALRRRPPDPADPAAGDQVGRALRNFADAIAVDASHGPAGRARPDVVTLRRHVEALLADLRGLDSAGDAAGRAAPPSPSPRNT